MTIICSRTNIINGIVRCAKTQWRDLERDSKIFQLKSEKTKPTQQIAVFGSSETGALGLKKLIDIKLRIPQSYTRKIYSLTNFNDTENVSHNMRVKFISCGYGFTLFAGKSSRKGWMLYGCGLNTDSQLGLHEKPDFNDPNYQVIANPRHIFVPTKPHIIKSVSCGKSHSVVVSEVVNGMSKSQVLFSMGNNEFGQCGREIIPDEQFKESHVTNQVNFNEPVKQVVCGENSTYLLTEAGQVYSFGLNDMGQLGVQSGCNKVFTPTLVEGALKDKVVRQISCSYRTVLAVTDKSELIGWGDNEYGLLFDNDDSCILEPIMLKNKLDIKKVYAGFMSCGIIDGNGSLHTWGLATSVGHGPRQNIVLRPTQLPRGLFGNSNDVIDLGLGHALSSAVTNDGSVFIWGNRLSFKSTEEQTFPLRHACSFRAKSVSVGPDHAVFQGISFL